LPFAARVVRQPGQLVAFLQAVAIFCESFVSRLMSEVMLPGFDCADASAFCTELAKSLTAELSAGLPAAAASLFSLLMKAFTWDLADDGCSARLPSVLGAFPSVVWILRQAAATPDVVLGAECDAVAAGEVFGAEVWPELLQPAARIMSAARAGMAMKPRSANLCMPLLLRFPAWSAG
jgi:hypothetical protein